MKEYQQTYRKNFSLVIIFLILITAALGGALFLAYKLTSKYVENEFASQKIEVLEETIKPYNDFFQNKIPEISFYQGFLDSAQAAKYIDKIFTKFNFFLIHLTIYIFKNKNNVNLFIIILFSTKGGGPINFSSSNEI